MKGLLARKLGMSQLFNPDGTISAVTVLEAGPCRVLGLRTAEKDGYSAVRIAFQPAKEGKLNEPELGEFKKASFDAHRHIVEIRNYDGVEQGPEIAMAMLVSTPAWGEPLPAKIGETLSPSEISVEGGEVKGR